jgi:hypothetical protein
MVKKMPAKTSNNNDPETLDLLCTILVKVEPVLIPCSHPKTGVEGLP